MNNQGQHTCAACGWRQLKQPQRSSSGGASHEICPSCGFESGYTDDDQGISYEEWRAKWVASGLQWFSKGKGRPAKWNPMAALHSLLRRKRPVIPPVRIKKAESQKAGTKTKAARRGRPVKIRK